VDPNSPPGVSCCIHPGNPPEWVCTGCRRYYCDQCVDHKKVGKFVAHICPSPQCRGRCVAVAMDSRTGEIEEAEAAPQRKEKKESRLKEAKQRFLTRYYISLVFPSITLVTYDIFLVLQGKNPVWWLLFLWACLIFLMSGRYFWSYVCVALFCFMFSLNSFYRIYSHNLYPKDNPLLNKIALGMWVLSFLILLVSHPEFDD